MGREGVIDELHLFGPRVISRLFGGRYAPDASGINLNKTEPGIINHAPGLMKIMAAFAPRKLHPAALQGQFVIRAQGS